MIRLILSNLNQILLKGDYDVKISSEGLAHFKHKEIDLEYWIATSPHSTYERDKKYSESLRSYEHINNFLVGTFPDYRPGDSYWALK